MMKMPISKSQMITLLLVVILAVVVVYYIRLYMRWDQGLTEGFEAMRLKEQPIDLARNMKSEIHGSQVSNYYKCAEKPISPILEEIFEKYGIVKSGSMESAEDKSGSENKNKSNIYRGMGTKGAGNWELYIPCGYNYVESELPEIRLSDSPKPLYIFGINGCDKMVSKNNIWSVLKKYYGLEGASDVMPVSYVLDDQNDMIQFKNDYRDDQIYILKKNVQRKEGLKLTKDYKEILNASGDEYKVVQKYIRDLYLINGYKVNLRIYLLAVIRGDDKQFYISDLGKCIYTKKPYKDDDFDFESNITSYHLDMNIYKKNPRTFEDLIGYINKHEDNPNAGSLFMVRVRKIIQKMCIALSNEFFQSENLRKRGDDDSLQLAGDLRSPNQVVTSFQLFGVDVIMDKDLNPYLLEVNKGPDMSARDDVDHVMKLKVQTDMLEKVGIIQDDFVHTTNSFK